MIEPDFVPHLIKIRTDVFAGLMNCNSTESPTEYIPVCSPHYSFTGYKEAVPEETEDEPGNPEDNFAT